MQQSTHASMTRSVNRTVTLSNCVGISAVIPCTMLFCKRVVDSVSESQYYLLVSVHHNTEDAEHSSSLDVQVTDGQTAWSQMGKVDAKFATYPEFCLMKVWQR